MALCVWAFRSCSGEGAGHAHARRFWCIVAATLFLLGINKQLDLQTLLWHTGRAVAKSQGWYEHRRLVQYAFLGCIATLGILVLRFLIRTVRPARVEHSIVIAGTTMLLCFILLRVVSIHPIDHALAVEFAGLSPKNVIEFGGILMVCTGAIKAGLAEPPVGSFPLP
jgi:hypothetical protein